MIEPLVVIAIIALNQITRERVVKNKKFHQSGGFWNVPIEIFTRSASQRTFLTVQDDFAKIIGIVMRKLCRLGVCLENVSCRS